MGTSVRKNFIWNLLMRVSGIVFPLITYPYVSRILQPEGLGRVVFAESFVAYLVLLAQMGIPVYGIRECARRRDEQNALSRTAHELLFIGFLMGLVAYGILGICLMGVPKLKTDWPLFLILSGQIAAAALDPEWLFAGLEKYRYIAIRTIAVRLIMLLFLFATVRHEGQYLWYALLLTMMHVIPTLLNLIFAGHEISFRWMGEYRPSRHWKAAFVFFAVAGMNAIYTNLDKVMLGFLIGDGEVGYYSVGVKVRQVLFLCVTALTTVLLPRASYYLEQGREKEYRAMNARAMHFLVAVAVPLAVFFTIAAGEVVMLLAGPAYLQAVLPMRILVPGLIMSALNYALASQILIPAGEEIRNLWVHAVGAVLNLLFNALLIPKCGSVGAAVGSLIAETAVLTLLVYSVKGRITLREFGFGKVLPASAVSGAVAVLVDRTVQNAKMFEGMGIWENLLLFGLLGVLFFGIYGGILLVMQDTAVTEILGMILQLGKPAVKGESGQQENGDGK